MDGDNGRFYGAGHVHRPAIPADQQVGSFEQRRKLGQAGFACQVQWLFTHASDDLLDQRQIVGRAGQDYVRVLLADQPIEQRGPVRGRPAFGLSVVGADMAGDDWTTWLHPLLC